MTATAHTLSLPNLIVVATAAFRLTWLLVDDYLTVSVRGYLVRAGYRAARRDTPQLHDRARTNAGLDLARLDEWPDLVAVDDHPPKAAYVWTCPWCAGLWVSAATVAAAVAWPTWVMPACQALAVAALVALTADVVVGKLSK